MMKKKTTLRMVDSEVQDIGCQEPSNQNQSAQPSNVKNLSPEEYEYLKCTVEQQETFINMIMTKYREQIDSLTKATHTDVRTLYYQRFLNTIIKQSNEMNHMTQMMRKNLCLIYKYEEVMKQIELENENLRDHVKKLTRAVKEAEEKAFVEKPTEVDAVCQTCTTGKSVSTDVKTVGTSIEENDFLDDDPHPGKYDQCTAMILYKPFPDTFTGYGTIHSRVHSLPPSVDVDSAFDLEVNRLAPESKLTSNNDNVSDIQALEKNRNSESEDPEVFEDSNDLATSTSELLTVAEETFSENSITESLLEDSNSKIEDLPEENLDCVQ